MKKKDDISAQEYSAILHSVATIVVIVVLAISAGGAYAITKLFHLQWWAGVLLWLLFVVIWAGKPNR
jgi:hypothetical protein